MYITHMCMRIYWISLARIVDVQAHACIHVSSIRGNSGALDRGFAQVSTCVKTVLLANAVSDANTRLERALTAVYTRHKRVQNEARMRSRLVLNEANARSKRKRIIPCI